MKREYEIKQYTHDQKEQLVKTASKEDILKAI
jgi:predicted GIY-YIG superfamily endonuclease